MSTDQPGGFADNWAYLKTELNWLDRILVLAVARYRQEKRSIDRVAQTHADRVSSHWWKGVVALEGSGAYDDYRATVKPAASGQRVSYHQQLEDRIRASRKQNIVLALPTLCDRLKLTPFEKNVILIGLAPEVNRRFAHLYRYLQDRRDSSQSDLPTVELVLRLFCRNDSEWRVARQRLVYQSPLVHHRLVTLLQHPHDTLLTSSVKLSEPLIGFLLDESPSAERLEQVIRSSFIPTASAPSLNVDLSVWPGANLTSGQSLAAPENLAPERLPPETWAAEQSLMALPERLPTIGSAPICSAAAAGEAVSGPTAEHDSGIPRVLTLTPQPQRATQGPLQILEQSQISWADLVLPQPLLDDLSHLCHQAQYSSVVEQDWGLQTSGERQSGILALLAGASGTGKRTAAQAIAHQLNAPLHWVDLDPLAPGSFFEVLAALETAAPALLLLQHAHHWLSSSRVSPIPPQHIQQLLTRRRQQGGLTLFSVASPHHVAPHWARALDQVLEFPMPSAGDRLRLWQRACGSELPLARDVDLELLSGLELSGGTIMQLVRDGAIAAAAREASLTLDDVKQALRRRGHNRALKQLIQHEQRRQKSSQSKAKTKAKSRAKSKSNPKTKTNLNSAN